MIALISYLFLVLFVSFLCSILKSVLLSTSQTFLIVKQEKGNAWAKRFIDYKINIDKPLSAILPLNTVAHTVGAAGVGAQAVIVFRDVYFGIVSATLTFLILVVTEIIPKTLGTRYWRNLAKTSYFIIWFMIIIYYPQVLILSFISNVFSKKSKTGTTSREEIGILAKIGADEGLFSEKENKIIQNVLKLKDVKVREIMTPRVVVVSIDEGLTLNDFLKNLKSAGQINFSHVYTNSH